MKLPESFQQRMHEYFVRKELASEEPEFWSSYEKEPWHGIRWNRLKIAPSEYESKMKAMDLSYDPVSWCEGGSYTPDISLGRESYYHAGAYYIQEPSAMLPASVLGTNLANLFWTCVRLREEKQLVSRRIFVEKAFLLQMRSIPNVPVHYLEIWNAPVLLML